VNDDQAEPGEHDSRLRDQKRQHERGTGGYLRSLRLRSRKQCDARAAAALCRWARGRVNATGSATAIAVAGRVYPRTRKQICAAREDVRCTDCAFGSAIPLKRHPYRGWVKPLEAAGLAVTVGCQRSGFAGDRALGLWPGVVERRATGAGEGRRTPAPHRTRDLMPEMGCRNRVGARPGRGVL